ncbi:hypothetical protein HYY70_06155 [Candidatus Woesearchaeota archaeon]|nr:hypothetical protein [Candidatus Woesearchaeota archaeon]
MVKRKEVGTKPEWFYYVSILAAFIFTMYISVYSAIHFENIKYMNVVVVFLFLTMVFFFIISAVYFHTEKMGYHTLAPVLFFTGIASLIIYAYKAADTTNIVRYSIIYTILVVGISLFIILPKKRFNIEKAVSRTSKKFAEKDS